jgi:hypothetical protein
MSNDKLYVYGCKECRFTYPIGHESTLWLYLSEPALDHVVTVCPKCQNTRTFWDRDPQDIGEMLRMNVVDHNPMNVEIADVADELTRLDFAADTGRTYPNPQPVAGE